jgi:hypothetical protein
MLRGVSFKGELTDGFLSAGRSDTLARLELLAVFCRVLYGLTLALSSVHSSS